jgi:hypothetical protein
MERTAMAANMVSVLVAVTALATTVARKGKSSTSLCLLSYTDDNAAITKLIAPSLARAVVHATTVVKKGESLLNIQYDTLLIVFLKQSLQGRMRQAPRVQGCLPYL